MDEAAKKISDECVLVFLRAPDKGKVKTRLAQLIGEEKALAFYKQFVARELEMLAQGSFCKIIFYHPENAEGAVAEWLGGQYDLVRQLGADLGRRMAAAFEEAFARGCRKALLIGSDLPDLPYRVIVEAFDKLDGAEAVIGPAKDGGYYLIGFRSETCFQKVFDGIAWGGADVFEKTLLQFRREAIRFHVLPEWFDIDDYEDLVMYLKRQDRENGMP